MARQWYNTGMPTPDPVAVFQAEQVYLRSVRAQRPDDVAPRHPFTPAQVLAHIGIQVDFGPRPEGILKLYHQDFVVEEVGRDGTVSTVEPTDATVPVPTPAARTLYADLVKVGLDTLEACAAVARALHLPPVQVSYAGLKDKVAITAQRIAIRGADPDRLAQLNVPGLFLKNFAWGSGAMEKGGLAANRFTIVVRTPAPVAEVWLATQVNRWRSGFHNFYYLQRFGTPRLISHVLGKLLLRGEPREVVRHFLAERGIQDVPLHNRIRETAEAHFGDWTRLREAFAVLPYTFRLELALLDHLAAHPDDYAGALRSLGDQPRLWVYAYASFLFNLHLSRLVQRGEPLPPELPLLLHPQASSIDTYVQQLAADGIASVERAVVAALGHRPISDKNVCRTTVPVVIHAAKAVGQAVLLAFDLPPGTYATTFLVHLFALRPAAPLPEWLDRTRYDSKVLLGTGSVAAVEKMLGPYIFTPGEGAA